MSLTKSLLLPLAKILVAYSLCIFYNGLTGIVLLYNYWTKYETKFWIPKEHNVPPKSLANPEFGKHAFITVNGVKLHYVEAGDAKKPLMLFVHGFPEFWYSWRYQLKEFSKDYRAVAFDMRGYGDSDKPSGLRPYHIKHMTEDIRCLIKGLGHDKCTLVCHDWGAVIGWNFVSHHMDMVDKYVMMGAPSGEVWRKIMVSSWEQFRKSWYVFFFQMPYMPEFTLSLRDYDSLRAIGSNTFSSTFTEEDLEAYKYTFAKKNALTAPMNYYRMNLEFFGERSRPKISKYAPGLFILGEKDLYISQESGAMLKKQFENLRFETVQGANHFVQQDAPEQTNQLIREFLKN